jgi:hypothetical protein
VDRLGFIDGNVTWINLDSLAFILHFLNQFELKAGWSMVAVVDHGEVDRPAVYGRYNNDPGTLPWGTPALTDDSSVSSVSTFLRKCLLCK